MNTLSLARPRSPFPSGLPPPHAQDAECGDVQIAEMNWASAGVLAQLDKIILEEGYGCDVELVTGDTLPTFASMTERSEPDVAPEVWVNSMREQLDEQVEAGTLVLAASSLSDGAVEGHGGFPSTSPTRIPRSGRCRTRWRAPTCSPRPRTLGRRHLHLSVGLDVRGHHEEPVPRARCGRPRASS